jgi:hypothetical protein
MNASPGLPFGVVSMAVIFVLAPGPLKGLGLVVAYFVG